MTVPELTFLAPPPLPGADLDDAVPARPPARPRSRGDGARDGSRADGARGGSRADGARGTDPSDTGPGALRMTRGARTAATNMGISEADVRQTMDAPDSTSPDPDKPSRTHFHRGRLSVVAGADGMVLRVERRR